MKRLALILFCVFYSAVSMAMNEPPMPIAIALYQKPLSWSDEQEIELQRSEVLLDVADKIKKLKAANKNLNYTDVHQNSVLYDLSCDDDFSFLVKLLLHQGASANLANNEDQTPFERALRNHALRNAWHMVQADADCSCGMKILHELMPLTQEPSLFSAQRALYDHLLKKMREELPLLTAEIKA